MPLESTIVAGIVRMAERHGWLTTKLHGGPMQKSGLPDLLMLRDGRAVFLEVKRPGLGKKSEPTPLQRRRMDELHTKGGCKCFCVTSVAEAEFALLNGWMYCTPPTERRTATDPMAAKCEKRSSVSRIRTAR
jgi:hypothetical protein